MLFRALAAVFNRIPGWAQRRILDRTHARFLVGVAGLGVQPDGRVLLARHRFGAPQWRLLGGFMGRGEQPRDALAREIREETGLEIEVGPLLGAGAGERWSRVELVYAFRVGGGTLMLTGELAELRAFPTDALPEVRPDQRELIGRHAAAALEWARSAETRA